MHTHNIVTRNTNLTPEIAGMVTEVHGIGMAKVFLTPCVLDFADRATTFRFCGLLGQI